MKSEAWTVLIDGPLMVVVGVPVAIISYLWMHVKAGWALGEWAFDADAFIRRYGKK